jgi:DNA-binding transcriptional ArsR family regulator
MQQLLSMLQGVADPTRLRLLFLLGEAELTVSELTEILGQSQPRVSRHLRLLCEAGLLERFKEGSWVFHRLSDAAARRCRLMRQPLPGPLPPARSIFSLSTSRHGWRRRPERWLRLFRPPGPPL